MEENENSSDSVITLEEGSGYFPIAVSSQSNNLSRPVSISSDCDIAQAHTALSTAYNSLKSRLLRTESENIKLKRDRRSVSSQHNSIESSPTMKRSPQRQDGVAENNTNILRQKIGKTLERQDGNYHQRHGSWGYTNDHHIRNEDQYCKLMEIQLSKGEEEKIRLENELKEVRLKLTEVSIKSDKIKRTDSLNQGKMVAQRDLENKLKNTENKVYELNDTLLMKENAWIAERSILTTTIAELKRQLGGKQPSYDVTSTGDVMEADMQNLMALVQQTRSELQRTKQKVSKQKQVILSLRTKQLYSTQAVHGTVRSACQTDDHMTTPPIPQQRPSNTNGTADQMMTTIPLICQAQSDDTTASQVDAFGKYYLHPTEAIRESNGITNGAVRSPKPVLTPKMASENTTFGFVPIKTHAVINENNRQHKVPYQLDDGDYIGDNIVFDTAPRTNGNTNSYRQHNGNKLNNTSTAHRFDIDDHVTTNRISSEDIVINLEPQRISSASTNQMKRSLRICEPNEVPPPPSPCRRLTLSHSSSTLRQSPPSPTPEMSNSDDDDDEHQQHPVMQPEATETSTSSDEVVPVRRPVDMMNEHGYVNKPRTSMVTSQLNGTSLGAKGNIAIQQQKQQQQQLHLVDKTNTGAAHNGFNDFMEPTRDKHYRNENIYINDPVASPSSPQRRYVTDNQTMPRQPLSNTHTGLVDVRPKVYSKPNTDPDVRPKINSPSRRDASLQHRRDVPVADLPMDGVYQNGAVLRNYNSPLFTPQNNISFFDQRSTNFDPNATQMSASSGTAYITATDSPRTLQPSPPSPQRNINGTTTTTSPSTTGSRNNHYVNATKLPQPVENSENGENDSLRDRSGSDAGNSCIICHQIFGMSMTLAQKEDHVNACLAERPSSVPEAPECPVCKMIFPAQFPSDKLTEHVNSHFLGEEEALATEYVVVSN